LIIPGRTNRFMNALVPDSVVRSMIGKMFEQSLAAKVATRHRKRVGGK
jgi:hypothetical protein